jgi:hypothetical protein
MRQREGAARMTALRPIAVSTWSLHNLLGVTYVNGPGVTPTGIAEPTFGPGAVTLEELPSELARRGYFRVEICHFNLASQDPAFLAKIRAAFEASGVVIQTLLIDDGDITNPATRGRDLAWIASWIDAAALLGAENARVIAGKSKPTPEALALSVDGLKAMAALGKACGITCWTPPALIWASSPTPATGAGRRNMRTFNPSSPAPSFATPRPISAPELLLTPRTSANASKLRRMRIIAALSP